MKKNKTSRTEPKLYELEEGVKRPKRVGVREKSEETKRIEYLLKVIVPGKSFLIKKNQEGTVRRATKALKIPYKISITTTGDTTGDSKDLRRVWADPKDKKK